VRIRPEQPSDAAGIRAVHEAAFEQSTEADLVDLLRTQASPLISLVAEADGIAGHILLSPVTLLGHPDLNIMGLAPMAVLPAAQRQGIGSALVRAGLDACRSLGAGAVIVLGHAEYYPRFGFVRAARYGIRSEYDVADEGFMVAELTPGYLTGASGTVRYHPVFGSV
jgi:putative acetyltransferase